MPPSVFPARRSGGFTLIELLVVITIIAILAGLALSVFGTVQNRSRKVQAINDMKGVKVACITYYNDNRRYPITQDQQNAINYGFGDTIFGDPGGTYSSADLFNILRAVPGDKNPDNILNPSKTVYWEGPYAKSITNPRSGISVRDFMDGTNKIPKGSLMDPWGNAYIAWVNVNHDGDLTKIIKQFYQDLGDDVVKTGEPPAGIEFTSFGPDGEWGTHDNFKFKGADDVHSWAPEEPTKVGNQNPQP